MNIVSNNRQPDTSQIPTSSAWKEEQPIPLLYSVFRSVPDPTWCKSEWIQRDMLNPSHKIKSIFGHKILGLSSVYPWLVLIPNLIFPWNILFANSVVEGGALKVVGMHLQLPVKVTQYRTDGRPFPLVQDLNRIGH